MTPIIIDLVILAVLVLFVAFGWKKGLLLSLCGLVVVIVSFVGAGALSNVLQEPVAKVIQPKVEDALAKQFSIHTDDWGLSSSLGSLDLDSQYGDLNDLPEGEWDHVLNSLKEQGIDILDWIKEELGGTVQSSVADATHQLVEKASYAIALKVAHAVVFVVVFLLLLIVLTILLHALNLVAKLPVLRTFNGMGGAIIGLIKALIILFAAAWVIRAIPTLVPKETVKKTYLLQFFLYTNPLSLLSWF